MTSLTANATPMVDPNTKPNELLAEEHSERAGSRSLELSNAVARLHKQFIGRGPTNARTTIDGDLVVVLLEGGYTRAELVAAGRVGLQDAMRQAMVSAVERITDRRVLSFMSANDLERNLQAEIFVLEPEVAMPEARLAS